MLSEQKFTLIILTPLIGMLLPFLLGSVISVKPSLTPLEREIMTFAPNQLSLVSPKSVTVASLAGPITIPLNHSAATPSQFPPVSLASMAPQNGTGKAWPGAEHQVSMIVTNNGNRLAIINGFVVKEGDRLHNSRVARIEQERVLLKDGKGESWVHID